MEKVYCRECDYYRDRIDTKCDLIKKEWEEDRPDGVYERRRYYDYRKLNKNNNCPYWTNKNSLAVSRFLLFSFIFFVVLSLLVIILSLFYIII